MAEEDDARVAQATWFTPAEALDYVAKLMPRDQASHAIWERLRGGMISAVAATSSSTLRDGSPVVTTAPSFIPGGHWNHFSATGSTTTGSTNFWQTGDARFFIPTTRARRDGVPLTIRCFGIKLHPGDLAANLPSAPKSVSAPLAPVAPMAEMSASPDNEQLEPTRRPPVADAFLIDWYQLYRRAYPGPEDTERNALRSAEGMFPGRYVARQRVRDLRGQQRRGRKARGADE
jgi:hypothetical protein